MSEITQPTILLLTDRDYLVRLVAQYLNDNMYATDNDLFDNIPITFVFDGFPDIISTLLSMGAIDSRKKVYFGKLYVPEALPASLKYQKLFDDSLEPVRNFYRKNYNNDPVIEKFTVEDCFGFVPTTIQSRNIVTIKIKDLVYNIKMLLTSPIYSNELFKPLYSEIMRMIESLTGIVIDLKKFNPQKSYNSLDYDCKLLYSHILNINKETTKMVHKYTNGKVYIRSNIDDGILPILKVTQSGLKIDLPYEVARFFMNYKGMYMRMIDPPEISNVGTESLKPMLPRLTQIDKANRAMYTNDDVNSIVYSFNRMMECYCFATTADWITLLERFSSKFYSSTTRGICQWIARQFEFGYNMKLELVDYRRKEDISIKEFVTDVSSGSEYKDSLQ